MKLLFITASGFDSFGGSNHLNIALIEDLLKKNHEVLLIQSQITNDSNIGIVIRQNKKFPTRPVIRLIKNKHGEKYLDWIEKDLTQNLTLFIKDTIDI